MQRLKGLQRSRQRQSRQPGKQLRGQPQSRRLGSRLSARRQRRLRLRDLQLSRQLGSRLSARQLRQQRILIRSLVFMYVSADGLLKFTIMTELQQKMFYLLIKMQLDVADGMIKKSRIWGMQEGTALSRMPFFFGPGPHTRAGLPGESPVPP